MENLGDQPGFHIGNSQWLAEGFPIASYLNLRLVSAELDNAGNSINVMCDGGAGNDHQPVPCASAPDTYLGQPVPKWEGAVRASATIFRNLRLYALADFKAGYLVLDQTIGSQVQPPGTARSSVLRNDPILQACNNVIQTIARAQPNFCRGLRKGDFAKLRELSASYTLPEKWTRGMHLSRASMTVSGRNLAILWAGQPELFGVKIVDPEVRMGDEVGELSNFVRHVMPQTTQVVTTLRVTF